MAVFAAAPEPAADDDPPVAGEIDRRGPDATVRRLEGASRDDAGIAAS